MKARTAIFWLIPAILSLSAGIVLWNRHVLSGGSPHQQPLRNLVLISIDTLRADRLGIYGYGRDTSPNIDRLASESVVFTKAVTPAPWTLPAHISLMTGLNPYSHGVRKPKSKLPSSVPLLAEVLKSRGFRTLAVTGGGYLSRTYGFDRGFDKFLQYRDYARGAEKNNSSAIAVKRAKAELAKIKSDQPYFLFFHTYDVHCPYKPPKEFLLNFETPGAEAIDPEHCPRNYPPYSELSDQQGRFLSDRYDESIRAVDRQLKDLIGYIKGRRDGDQTIIILTSDHGEEFLDHGKIGHRDSLFSELLFVPLIIHLPNGMPATVRVPVSLIDVFPTVLQLLRIGPESRIDGSSLIPLIGSDKPTPLRTFQYSELEHGSRLRSRIGELSQLILNLDDGSYKLFDLIKDPGERKDVSGLRPNWFREKKFELAQFLEQSTSLMPKQDEIGESEDVERLKSLGYL